MCRSKVHLLIEELFADEKVICRLKNYLQIEDLTADQRIIFCRSEDLQIKEVFDMPIEYLQIEELSAYQISIYRYFFDLQTVLQSSDTSLICRYFFGLQIECMILMQIILSIISMQIIIRPADNYLIDLQLLL